MSRTMLDRVHDGSVWRDMLESVRWTGRAPFAIGDRVIRNYGYSSEVGIVRGYRNCGLAFPQVYVEWPPSNRRKSRVTKVFSTRLLPADQWSIRLARDAQQNQVNSALVRLREDFRWQNYAISLTIGRH